MVELKTPSYEVVLERDRGGAWLASVPTVPGCHTHGRSLAQARRRIREALALWVDDAAGASLDETIRLPAGPRAAVERSRASRATAEREQARAQLELASAARTLVGELQLGLRDAGELLGVSHQRVQQLLDGARTAAPTGG